MHGARKNILCKNCVNYYKGEGIADALKRGFKEGMSEGRSAQRIKKLILESEILCDSCGESTSSYCAEALADYLVANGVKTDGEEGTK